MQAAHGRAPAVGTGLKRANPDSIVISYQGDGDLASSGTAEIIHAATRGENFTVIFINNAIYGMTGGQMAPTTLVGQASSTSPYGRDPKFAGHPIHVSEMLATLKAPRYIERTVARTTSPTSRAPSARSRRRSTSRTRARASPSSRCSRTCPTNWGVDPSEAVDWMESSLMPEYPLGVFRDVTKPEVK